MDKLHVNEYPPYVFVCVKIIWLSLCVGRIIPFCSILILDVSRWDETVLHSDCARRLHPALAVYARAFPSRSHPSIRGVIEESHPTRAETILLKPKAPFSGFILPLFLISTVSFLFFLPLLVVGEKFGIPQQSSEKSQAQAR